MTYKENVHKIAEEMYNSDYPGWEVSQTALRSYYKYAYITIRLQAETLIIWAFGSMQLYLDDARGKKIMDEMLIGLGLIPVPEVTEMHNVVRPSNSMLSGSDNKKTIKNERMRTVYKYALDTDNVFLPKYATILHVGLQDGNLFAWALVDLDYVEGEKVPTLRVAETGHPIHSQYYHGTFWGTHLLLGGKLVFHVWQIAN